MRLIPDSRRGAFARFAIAAAIVIVFTATTTAVAGLLQFKQAVIDISVTPPIKNTRVTIPSPGDPQTILIVGSDHRAGTPFRSANTDTMLLVRLDAGSSTINVLSVPRDLKVQIPQPGGFATTGKLNSAYSIGGPNLLVRVLRQQVFPGLKVNHIVDINFGGFQALVNAIGCVYSDVDRRYYNDTKLTDYSSIDIQPGYQRLCGTDPVRGALAFVRFRHADSDIVRNARQQDFIRWAKDQYGPTSLVTNKDELLKIFGAHTETDPDLHHVDGLINLFNLVAFSAGHSIRQVRFPATLSLCAPAPAVANRFTPQSPCYVTADPDSELQAFSSFMTPSQPVAGGGSASARAPAPRRGAPPASTTSLTADVSDGKAQAVALRPAGMPVYYPRLIATGSSYCLGPGGHCPVQIPSPNSYPRAYTIRDRSGAGHSAYRITLVMNANLGQYYGVQGTTWRSPPILARPNQTRTVGGKRLALYLNGHKVSLVAWRAPRGVYWVSNTLTDDLSNQQMLGIAASLSR